jgi:hypothetical protein
VSVLALQNDIQWSLCALKSHLNPGETSEGRTVALLSRRKFHRYVPFVPYVRRPKPTWGAHSLCALSLVVRRQHIDPQYFSISDKGTVTLKNVTNRNVDDVMRTKSRIMDAAPLRLEHSARRLLYPPSAIERQALELRAESRTLERTTRASQRMGAAAAAAAVSDGVDAASASSVDDIPTEELPLCYGVRHSTVVHGEFPTPEYVSDSKGWDRQVSQARHRARVVSNFGGDLDKSVHGIMVGNPSGVRPTGLAADLLPLVKWAITGPEQLSDVQSVICAVAIAVERPASEHLQRADFYPAVQQCVSFLFGNVTAFLSYVDSDDGKTKEGVFRCPHCTTTSTSSTSTRCRSCSNVQRDVRRLVQRSALSSTAPSTTRNRAATSQKGGALKVLADLTARLAQANDNVAARDALIKEQSETISSLRADLERLAETDTLSTTVAEDDAEAEAASATLKAAQSVLRSDLTPSSSAKPPSLPPEQTVLDDVLPPNSLGRLMWDANLRNLESQIRTGNKKGARYSVEIHQIALMILSKAGSTCYTKLSEALPCLPTLRRIQLVKGNYPVGETGALTSRMETMDHMLSGTKSDDPDGDRIGVLSFDEMHVGKWPCACSGLAKNMPSPHHIRCSRVTNIEGLTLALYLNR